MASDRPPDGITIRRCATGDRRPCACLFETVMRKTFLQDEPAPYARGRFEQHVAGEEIWVAVSTAGPVGFVSYWAAEPFVHVLIVAEPWRRAGIGRALLRRAVTAANGPVDLKCRLASPAACRFYETLGWRAVDRDEAAAAPFIRYRWKPGA